MKDEKHAMTSSQTRPRSDTVGRVIYGTLTALIFAPLVLFVLDRLSLKKSASQPTTYQAQMTSTKSDASLSPFLGTPILKDYASAAQPPQQDLTDLSNALSNFALLIKGAQPIPLGANEEIAAALRGKNKTKTTFLPADAPCFNAQGQVVDRWQSPLFFHVLDQHRIDIRSAGPDKEMWTADDLHRRYDGQFVRDEALNSPSLLDATKEYRGQK